MDINDEAIISCEMATENGFIEKLCATFGFIKCLNKDNQEKRLFFHSSEVKSGFEEMKINDYVTFERGFGNGKPLARKVVIQLREGEHVDGIILKMPKKNESGNISYKFNEECFYVPFDREAIMEQGKLKLNDDVTFDCVKRDGLTTASNVCKKYNRPMRMQGVVTCIKDKYGFIDRRDVVKEIYFNVATCPEYASFGPGMEVEFNVKHLRNGKEEAVNLRMLEPGTVQFVDVYNAILYGTLLRCPDTKRFTTGDQLKGNISYVCPSAAKVLQIPFSDKDKLFPYSLHPGDIVSFQVAVDRRDELHHACNVQLCLDQFPSRKEPRHYGVIKMYDAPAGLIESDNVTEVDQGDGLVAFKDKEWLVPDSQKLTKYMAVSYMPMRIVKHVNGHNKTTFTALRIMPLKPKEQMTNLKLYSPGSLHGNVKTAAHNPDDLGIVICQLPSSKSKRSIMFTCEDVIGSPPKVGDEVVFGCLERTTKTDYLPLAAFDVKLSTNTGPMSTANNSSCSKPDTKNNAKTTESRKLRSRTLPDNKISLPDIETDPPLGTQVLRGWVVILKEFFAFVELSDHSTIYKFTPGVVKKSNLSKTITLGCAVEFTPVSDVTAVHKRVVDVFTKVLTQSTLSDEKVVAIRRLGTVKEPINIKENSDTDSPYRGTIVDCESEIQYPFTMQSLANYKTKLFVNDRVLFSVSQIGQDLSACRASNIQSLWQTTRVTAVKENVVHLVACYVDDRDGEDAPPAQFEFDYDMVPSGPGNLGVDDIVDLDFDLDLVTRQLFVTDYKLKRAAEPSTARRVFKINDESQARVLHWREPRIPRGDDVGFSDELRASPPLKC